MKRVKKILLLLLIVLPTTVLAYTQEEAQNFINTVPNEINVNFIDPRGYDGYIHYTKEDLLESEPEYYGNRSDTEIAEDLLLREEEGKMFYRETLLRQIQEEGLINLCDNFCSVFMDSFDKVRVQANYQDGSLEKEVTVNYATANESDINSARNILDGLEKSYHLRGLNTYSSVYHYGHIGNQQYGDFRILSSYEGLKEFMEQHNEYDYDVFFSRGGGPYLWHTRVVYVALKKDGKVLAYKEVSLIQEETIFVDKDLPGTPAEKALNLLKEFFNNKVTVEFDEFGFSIISEDPTDYSSIVNDIKVRYKNDDVSNVYYGSFIIDGKSIPATVVETNKDYISKGYSKSTDYSTGLNMFTDSYDVPTDAHIKATDVTDKDYVKKAGLDNNLKFISAFDINIIKGLTGAIVKSIDRGIEVYIPIESAGTFNIYHINEDGSLGDKFESEIVTIDGKKYIRFITFHFSTYGIAQQINNPKTGDNIYKYVTLLFIGLGGTYSFIKYLNKGIN